MTTFCRRHDAFMVGDQYCSGCDTERQRIDVALAEVRAELAKAIERFPVPFHSPHEGKAVIEEELDELWKEVTANVGREPHARLEAKQIAAMAVRYMVDLT